MWFLPATGGNVFTYVMRMYIEPMMEYCEFFAISKDAVARLLRAIAKEGISL